MMGLPSLYLVDFVVKKIRFGTPRGCRLRTGVAVLAGVDSGAPFSVRGASPPVMRGTF